MVSGRAHDLPLSDLGRTQAAMLGERLASFGIDAVYSSTCLRALETARPIAARLGLRVHESPLLVERSHGDLEGRLKVEVYTPEVVREIHADQLRWKPPGGESLEEAGGRVDQFFAELARDAPSSVCLAVTHQMLLWSLFHRCTRCDAAILPGLKLDNGAIVEIELGGDTAPRLVRWNWPILA